MPWREESAMSQREEFARQAMVEGANLSELCRGFGISRKSGYKWLRRFGSGDPAWSEERSRRPGGVPRHISVEVEAAVLAVRELHPAWGGRKIRRRLEMDGLASPPAASTITEVLRRHGRINPEESRQRGPMQRFEREFSNELWQMDFKGGVPTSEGMCHRLTLLGNVDCGRLLCSGAPEEVAAAVKKLIQGCAPGGGYILSSSNSIHSGVKTKNFLAMLEAARKFGQYPIQNNE